MTQEAALGKSTHPMPLLGAPNPCPLTPHPLIPSFSLPRLVPESQVLGRRPGPAMDSRWNPGQSSSPLSASVSSSFGWGLGASHTHPYTSRVPRKTPGWQGPPPRGRQLGQLYLIPIGFFTSSELRPSKSRLCHSPRKLSLSELQRASQSDGNSLPLLTDCVQTVLGMQSASTACSGGLEKRVSHG